MWRISIIIIIWIGCFLSTPTPVLASEAFRVQLSSDPWAWLVGPNARVDLRLTDHWSAGAGFMSQNRLVRAVNVSSFQPGGAVTYAFSGALDSSWLIDLSVYYGSVHASYVDANHQTDELTAPNWTTRLVVAHQWFFGHFGVELGAGEELNSVGNPELYDSSGQPDATLYLYPAQFILDLALSFAF